MTGAFSPERMVQEARYWANIGYHEGASNRNVFSTWQYGGAYNPWCSSFVDYCAYVGGFRFPDYCAFGEKGDSNVGAAHQHAIRQGIWRGPSVTMAPGDLAVFTFGIPDQHIEMCLSDNGSQQFATIGGNTGDAVRYRTRRRANLVGSIALTQAGQSAPPVAQGDTTVKNTDRTDAARTSHGGSLVLGADGGVFAYAPAVFYGSVPGKDIHFDLTKTWATSILLTKDEGGYWILGANGDVFAFGNAKFAGTFHGQLPFATAVKLVHNGDSYQAIRDDGQLLAPTR